MNSIKNYLVFALCGDFFGVKTSGIKEIIWNIRTMESIVRNGVNVPVVDIRHKIGMDVETRNHSCVIIADALSAEGKTPVGIVADSVYCTLDVSPECVEFSPREINRRKKCELLGTVPLDDKTVSLVDINELS